jgi:hypothetical protein
VLPQDANRLGAVSISPRAAGIIFTASHARPRGIASRCASAGDQEARHGEGGKKPFLATGTHVALLRRPGLMMHLEHRSLGDFESLDALAAGVIGGQWIHR